MSAPFAVFDFLALLVALGALAAVVQRDPVRAVLALLATSSGLAGCFVLLGAEALAALQWLISGASMSVLLLFALLSPAGGVAGLRERDSARLARATAALALLAGLVLALFRVLPVLPASHAAAESAGTQRALGSALLSGFGLPLQLLGLLLLAAVLAALLLVRERGRG